MKISEDTKKLVQAAIGNLDKILDDDTLTDKTWKQVNRMKKDLEYMIEEISFQAD